MSAHTGADTPGSAGAAGASASTGPAASTGPTASSGSAASTGPIASSGPAASTGPAGSARESVAEALRYWLAHGETWPSVHPLRFRNLLLDATGSDHRPLVELLLRVGRHGIVDALGTLGTITDHEWTARRAALVARTTSALFIDNDIAAWAVDSWAVALGVITPDALRQQRVLHAASVVRDAPTPRATAARAERRRGGVAPMPGGGTAVAPPLPGAPSWAGGFRSTRVGVVYSRTGLGVRAPWQGSSGPVHVPNVRRNVAVMGVVLVFALVWAAMANGGADASEAGVAGASISAAPSITSDSGRARPANTISDSMANRADTSATTAAIVPPASIASAPANVPTWRPSDDVAPLGALDTIRLRDGRTLVGAIRLVAPAALFAHDVRSGLEYSIPHAQILSVVTRTGVAVALPGVPSDGDNPAAVAAALINRGVGGRYAVEQRVLSVDGSATCGSVAEALGRATIRSIEEFDHEPGSRAFALVSRPGVRGTIDAAARFSSGAHAGERNGVRFVFRMTGYFTPGGFVARTVTETEASIRYRQTQRCRITADLLGTRTVPGTPDSAIGEPLAPPSRLPP